MTSGRAASPADQYAANFGDIHPPLTLQQSLVESDRCYFCYDAPCIEACPTGIDIPSFIHKIATGNVKGAAHDILKQNIMGAVCARVCPTEVLCEGACVRNSQEHKPVAIGALQRYATDALFRSGTQLFKAGPSTGKRVAVVGGGPAGLSCAHRLAMLGHAVTVFEARPKLGGLNEYGVAAYKVTEQIAQREVEYLLAVGNIEVKPNHELGRDVSLPQLSKDYDAVFVGVGLGAVNSLGVDEGGLSGVHDAIKYIEVLRQAEDLRLAGGRAAHRGDRRRHDGHRHRLSDQAAGRRGRDHGLPARAGADGRQRQGAGLGPGQWRAHQALGAAGAAAVRRRRAHRDRVRVHAPGWSGKLTGTGERYTLAADMVFKAIGQVLVKDPFDDSGLLLDMRDGRIAVDEERRTSIPGVWAGGDCVAGGLDLTVAAVEDGKQAALSIDRYLRT